MFFIRKPKKYVVYSTNSDKIMNKQCDPVLYVWRKNVEQMYNLISYMEPVNPNEFLTFEEVK